MQTLGGAGLITWFQKSFLSQLFIFRRFTIKLKILSQLQYYLHIFTTQITISHKNKIIKRYLAIFRLNSTLWNCRTLYVIASLGKYATSSKQTAYNFGKQYVFKIGKSHVKFPLAGMKTAFIRVIICLICIPSRL